MLSSPRIDGLDTTVRPPFGDTIIDAVHPVQSADLAAQLTKPTSSYKNSARLAVAGLLVFLVTYFAMAFWFLYTAYRVFFQGAVGAMGGLAYLVAIVATFLGVFMLKALFSVKNTRPEGLHEVSAQDQPKLFAFLVELADAAGAPRPHKVFLSARVNAAVFYDLSFFNLLFPSKKNLEIGLGLVNALSLGEFRAVLAHEFGHFAQRSMAVGRWVYVAQQIANHLVTRRDKLDDFLVGLGNIDLRIRAGVVVVQLIVWSIRSLVESAFNVVVLMQRALSREMEMQADLVAVSLTGSDALVHALHRMQGADDAWDRALNFVFSQRANGRATRDVFAVQSHMVQRMSAILDDEAYAKVPDLPQSGRGKHRVFKAEMAQPPRMWLTHPLNHEREANAKRVYVPAEIDPSSAWSVFNHPVQVREQMTARLLGESEAAPVELEESLKALARQFKREQYNRRYGGAFFGRSLTRHASTLQELRNPARASSLEELASLYPESLKHDVQQLRALETEQGQLRGLISGALTAPGGVVRLRGAEYRKKQLPAALRKVEQDIEDLNVRLRAHDYLCRSWHQGTAATLQGNWQPYLDGLLALIHYTEHTCANLDDLNGMLRNVTAVVTAGKVRTEGINRIVARANQLYHAMGQVFLHAEVLVLDRLMCQRLELSGNWREMLGEYTFAECDKDNINDWLNNVGSWLSHFDNCLSAVRTAALEQLLVSETMIVRVARQGGVVLPAPAPSKVPATYDLLLPGAERKRQTELDWFVRFQRADGMVPGALRLLTAGAIVTVVLGASTVGDNKLPGFAGAIGSMVAGKPTLMVYNGLGLPVVVKVDQASVSVPAFEARALEMAASGAHHIETRSKDGRLIEAFDADDNVGAHTVYNVAGATLLVEWSATYGDVKPVDDRSMGAPRWSDSKADFVFAKPPEKISGKGKGGYRTVLEGGAKLSVEQQLAMLGNDKDRERSTLLHAQWDGADQPLTVTWIDQAAKLEGHETMLAERLAAEPDAVTLRRVEFDRAKPAQQAVLCQAAASRAAAAPDNGNLAYLAIRCRRSQDGQAQMRQARERWPENAWIVNAVAFANLHSKDWAGAIPDLELVRKHAPAMAEGAALTIARLKRFEGSDADLAALAKSSNELKSLLDLDLGTGAPDSPGRAYAQLAKGSLGAAMAAAMGDSYKEAHVLRLAAASDGASGDSARRALALPLNKGMDAATAWTTLALAMKAGIDTAPLLAVTREQSGQEQPAVAAFLADLQAGKAPLVAERRLEVVGPEARAHAYSAALVLIGRKAPDNWRQAVRRLLFASERPYFA